MPKPKGLAVEGAATEEAEGAEEGEGRRLEHDARRVWGVRLCGRRRQKLERKERRRSLRHGQRVKTPRGESGGVRLAFYLF